MLTNEKPTVPADVVQHRLVNQQLVNATCKTPKDLVRHMGALQAQDYAMAKWAIGVRLSGSTDASIEKAIDAGDIIRTHILRPTWHFVAAEDVRWMMTLTAPHVNRLTSTMYRQLELDDAVWAKTNKIITRLLEGGKQLTREEIMTALYQENIPTNDLRAAHIMFRAELDQVVCSGPRRGKQFTYALFEERVPPGKPLTRQEALAKLTERYFTSHGPATIADFSWWSGLTITEIKQGLELIKPALISEAIGSQTYWFSPKQADKVLVNESMHLLPAFDEFTISYKDRSHCLDEVIAKEAILGNGIFKPMLVVNGKVTGIWRRTLKKNVVSVQLHFPDQAAETDRELFTPCIEEYGRFLNLKAVRE